MSIWPVYNGRRYDEAIHEAQALLQSDPSNAIAYHIIGQASLMKRDYTTALRAYDRLEHGDHLRLGHEAVERIGGRGDEHEPVHELAPAP